MKIAAWELRTCGLYAAGIQDSHDDTKRVKMTRRRNVNKYVDNQSLLGLCFSKPIVYVAAVSLLSLPFVTRAETLDESLKVTQEMSFSASGLGADSQSSVTTYNGNIYFVWVDNKLRTMIARKTPDGKVTTNVIEAKTMPDQYHTVPSIGVDKNGYIHVAYNMHQSQWRQDDDGWQYKVSEKPEDISSFTFHGAGDPRTIPGELITYPFFAKDNNGVLYVTFRHRTGKRVEGGGNYQGIGIARYDADTRRWTMVGGENYPDYSYMHAKTFFWTPFARHVPGKGPYQGYRARLFFDENNRMHVSWDVFVEYGLGPSHIMYAYSDDGGVTFHKADGTTIKSLPIVLSTPTKATADIVEAAPSGTYHTLTAVGVAPDGSPIVSFFDKKTRNTDYRVWNGRSWSDAGVMPASLQARFAADSNGVITAVDNGKFSRSFDGGKTWKAYKVTTGTPIFLNFDYAYLRETNKLRFQTIVNKTATVWTAQFSDENRPSPPTDLRIESVTN